MATIDKSLKKEKNQNIQVFVRLRPLNSRERSFRPQSVVEVVNNREVAVRQSHQTPHVKRFTFDRAFGPCVQQVEIYKEVVSPLIAEVLAGYNCTVFAYGQTGSGKTHTMVGESTGDEVPWQSDPLAGIIPRALSQLFDELRISNTEYTVRVSYLELYNEELCDLLSPSMDNSKLRIYEDVNRKGSTIVNGLEEITVYNKNQVYEIMSRGQERKKVAATLMNSQSSNHPNDNSLSTRSHTVFTIVVHIRENSPKGEELVKIGKLNLVDLAGSENISKAGSDNPAKKERARECVNINQSLLTLGRVITALVEKHPHIPYRESKLTRILQESLGGRTKTSIIATISPGHRDLEETMTTLEYANRAKNIQNKPEVNQKMTKQAILKQYAEEVDKLKRELGAARDKHGVYLPTDTYEEMTEKNEEQKREIQELLLKKRAMEDERERAQQVFRDMELQRAAAADSLRAAELRLSHTESQLQQKARQVEEQQHLVRCQERARLQLAAEAQQLLETADSAVADVTGLLDSVDRRREVETTNQAAISAYQALSSAQRESMLSGLQECTELYAGAKDELRASIDTHAKDTLKTQELNIQDLKLVTDKMAMSMNGVKTLKSEVESSLTRSLSEYQTTLEQSAAARRDSLARPVRAAAGGAAAAVARARAADVVGTVARTTEEWLSGAKTRISSLHEAHASFASHAESLARRRREGEGRRHGAALALLRTEEDAINESIELMLHNKRALEERTSLALAAIQRLEEEHERRMAEIVANVDTVRTQFRDGLRSHITVLREELETHNQSTEHCLELQRAQLAAVQRGREEALASLDERTEEAEEGEQHVKEYDTQFGEGVTAITADVEAFSQSVVHIVTQTNDQIMTELLSTQTATEQAANDALSADAAATERDLAGARQLATAVVYNTDNMLNTFAESSDEIATTSSETADAVTERCSRLAAATAQQQAGQCAALERASRAVGDLAEHVRGHAHSHADLERRHLQRQYRLYSPTGRTPARREFSYPRRLTAGSPPARLLQRLRRHPPPDADIAEDYIVVESDEGRNGSDSDEASGSSVSEDSGVAQQ